MKRLLINKLIKIKAYTNFPKKLIKKNFFLKFL